MEPPAKKPRLPNSRGNPELAAQNRRTKAQTDVAARKIRRQAARNEAHMQKFSLPADGFYLHKLDESVVKDAVASYHKVKDAPRFTYTLHHRSKMQQSDACLIRRAPSLPPMGSRRLARYNSLVWQSWFSSENLDLSSNSHSRSSMLLVYVYPCIFACSRV